MKSVKNLPATIGLAAVLVLVLSSSSLVEAQNDTVDAVPASNSTTGATGECAVEKQNGIENVSPAGGEGGPCVCDDGWSGPQCQVCTKDEACSNGGKCLESVALVDAIDMKTYSCLLDSKSPVLPFVGVPNFWGRCDLKERECTILFGGENTTQPTVECTATECAFGSKPDGTSGNLTTEFQCQSASCGASKYGWPASLPSFIRGPLGSRNTSIDISCKGAEKGGVCTVELAILPIPIDIQCSFGDCYGSADPSSSAGSSPSTANLIQDENLKTKSSDDEHMPIEMIFLPILVAFILIVGVSVVLYIESKKQYFRVLYSKEMVKLTGNKVVRGLDRAASDMSPALRTSLKFYPENSRSDKYSDLNMNIFTELAFKEIFYDVFHAPQEDEGWMDDSSTIQKKVGDFKKKLGKLSSSVRSQVNTSLRNMNKLVKRSRRKSASDGWPKAVELGATADGTEPNSLPPGVCEGSMQDDEFDGTYVNDDDIYTPQTNSLATTPRKTPIGSPVAGLEPMDSDRVFKKASRNHKTATFSTPTDTMEPEAPKDSSGFADSNTKSYFSAVAQTAKTMRRTASMVKEVVKDTFRSKKKRILHGVSGSIHRGEMLAIMGPSGCGKSTLLNILADGNLYGAKVRGSVEIDGQKRKKWYKHITTYIPQSDELIPILTVKESILYSGELQLPWYYEKGRRIHKVYEVLEQLKIDHVAESQVGGSCGIRGISGGERRRVSVGMGLIADPKIMILDEPTSGLDSAAASSIITTLKELAQKGDGRIVIASLHQPSFETFQELDLLLLLAKGREIYFGPADKVEHKFNRCGFPCPKGLNIADYILHVVSDLSCLREIISVQRELDALVMSDSEGPASTLTESNLGESMLMANVSAGAETLKSTESFKTTDSRKRSLDNLWTVEMYKPFTTEMKVMLLRSFKQIWRRPMLFRLQVVLAIIVGLLSIAMFGNMERTVAGVQNRIGFLFFQLAFFGFAGISSLDLILEERSVFCREIQGKFYTPLAYYLSKVLVDGLMLR